MLLSLLPPTVGWKRQCGRCPILFLNVTAPSCWAQFSCLTLVALKGAARMSINGPRSPDSFMWVEPRLSRFRGFPLHDLEQFVRILENLVARNPPEPGYLAHGYDDTVHGADKLTSFPWLGVQPNNRLDCHVHPLLSTLFCLAHRWTPPCPSPG
jgi:hypothetical protein